MTYIRISGRVQINAASLNAQGSVGNLTEITKLRVVINRNGTYESVEVPSITGNTIKHWHFVYFIKEYSKLNGNSLCDYCRRLIGYRTPRKSGTNEGNYIEECAGEDVHGFLYPDEQIRRESLIKFSFLIPIETVSEFSVTTVTHNRVVITDEGKIDKSGMMVFKRQYSSDIFGFNILADLNDVGKTLYSKENKIVLNNQEERKRRIKAAILAFIPLLTGSWGANISRSLPVMQVKELLVAHSQKIIPMTIHGFYQNYAKESIDVIKKYCDLTDTSVEIECYGISNIEEKSDEKFKVKLHENWIDLFNEIIKKLDKKEEKQKE